jgi:hypothetical protein
MAMAEKMLPDIREAIKKFPYNQEEAINTLEMIKKKICKP